VLSRGPLSRRRSFISRSEYRLADDRFRAIHTRIVTSSMTRVGALAGRWGMNTPPFTGCIVARGRRL
jgi:hypothetical protein